jgi:hypothetical protein
LCSNPPRRYLKTQQRRLPCRRISGVGARSAGSEMISWAAGLLARYEQTVIGTRSAFHPLFICWHYNTG